MALERINTNEFVCNPMALIGKDGMLITAGTKERGFNSMTASWGHLGSIWGPDGGAPTSVVYIRPQRYTKEFVDKEEYYTLSFFPNEYRDDLIYMGTHTGRDGDKLANTKLTPVFSDKGTWYEEASLVIVCRKMYHAPIVENGFVDKALIDEYYPEKDFHEMYVGEIVDVYMNME